MSNSSTMDYYDDPKHVEEYIKMAEGYDGRALVAVLRRYLPAESSVLELGMGPGTDLDILRQFYLMTGSDRSALFLERYRQHHPEADLLQLDALTVDTERRFDGIYSNKVLYHLKPAQLRQSLAAQRPVLHPAGVAVHSFWYGEGEQETHGLHFTYYTEATLRAQVGDGYTLVEVGRYGEMEPDDSLYIVLQRRD